MREEGIPFSLSLFPSTGSHSPQHASAAFLLSGKAEHPTVRRRQTQWVSG